MCVFIGSEELERDVEFEVVGEAPDKAPPPQTNQEEVNSITNGNKDSAQPSTSSKGQQERKLNFNTLCWNECSVLSYRSRVGVYWPSFFVVISESIEAGEF